MSARGGPSCAAAGPPPVPARRPSRGGAERPRPCAPLIGGGGGGALVPAGGRRPGSGGWTGGDPGPRHAAATRTPALRPPSRRPPGVKTECVGVLEAGEGDSGVGVVVARVKGKTAETLCGIEASRLGPGFWRAESLRRACPHPVPALFTKAQYRGHLRRETFAGPTCTGLGVYLEPPGAWCNAGMDGGSECWISCLQLACRATHLRGVWGHLSVRASAQRVFLTQISSIP